MKLWKRFVVAYTVAFLFYFCQIISHELETYRAFVLWSRQDVEAVFLGITLIASLAWTLDRIVTWASSPLLRRIFNHLFILSIAGCCLIILARVIHLPIILIEFLWLLLLVFIGFSLAKLQWNSAHYFAKLCLIFSPGIVLIAFQLFWNSFLPDRLENHLSSPSSTEETKNTPVFFFVIDEWSFLRSSEDGKFRPELKNICALAERSVIFTKAVSPAESTMQSLPSYIYQNDLQLVDHEGHLYFKDNDRNISTQELPSLFQLAGQHGYKTFLLGWYHSYGALLGKQVDYCNGYQFNCSPRHSFIDIFLWHLMRNLIYLNDPISLQLQLNVSMNEKQMHEMGTSIINDILQILTHSSSNTFGFFHTPWTHSPFVFNPDGIDISDKTSIPGYLNSIVFFDSKLGEIEDTLQAAGHFDDALLIFTADHGWRADPEPIFQKMWLYKRRVPLIIKLPGQKTGQVIDKEFCPNRLKPLLEAVFAGEKDTDKLLKILEDTVDAQP